MSTGKDSSALLGRYYSRPKKDDDDNDDDGPPIILGDYFNVTAAAALPRLRNFCLKTLLGVTITLYVLNQKHLLPYKLSSVVSRTLFWPSLPITLSRRIGTWTTNVDETVIMGGCPFGFVNLPERLYEEGVRGVINMCDEYKGPSKKYLSLGIQELRLPTVDHFEPSLYDLKRAVRFIRKYEKQGERVYVHCRAGHGRSAAAVFAWLLYKEPQADMKSLNEELCRIRNVRKTLWKQRNLDGFKSWLQHEGRVEMEKANFR